MLTVWTLLNKRIFRAGIDILNLCIEQKSDIYQGLQRKSIDIGDIRSQVMQELYDELYVEIKDEVRQELEKEKPEIVREIKDELKEKLKADLKRNLTQSRGEDR